MQPHQFPILRRYHPVEIRIFGKFRILLQDHPAQVCRFRRVAVFSAVHIGKQCGIISQFRKTEHDLIPVASVIFLQKAAFPAFFQKQFARFHTV